jgi:hypothetical protein
MNVWKTLSEALTQPSLQPSSHERSQEHSQNCVCRGSGVIWVQKHGVDSFHTSTPISGLERVPCPEGDLKVNKTQPKVDTSTDLADFDF